MSTYTQILYHIVFSTKNRERTLDAPGRDDLFRYIWGILKNNKCHLYRINGTEDHLHMLISLHPTVALSRLAKDIKVSTSLWLKANKDFPAFDGWQNGYGAFTHSINDKDSVLEYIKGQQKHHERLCPKEELRKLLEETQIEYEEKYLV